MKRIKFILHTSDHEISITASEAEWRRVHADFLADEPVLTVTGDGGDELAVAATYVAALSAWDLAE